MVVRQLMLPRDSLSSMVSLLSLNNTSREPSLVPKNKETKGRHTAGPRNPHRAPETFVTPRNSWAQDGQKRNKKDLSCGIHEAHFELHATRVLPSHMRHEVFEETWSNAAQETLLYIYIPQPKPFLLFGSTSTTKLKILQVWGFSRLVWINEPCCLCLFHASSCKSVAVSTEVIHEIIFFHIM